MLGAYIVIIVTSSSWINPLIIAYCPSLSLITAFILKSILSDMSPATSDFDFHFHRIPFFIPSLSICVGPFIWSGFLLEGVYIESCFCIHSVSLYPLVGTFNLFIFKVICFGFVFVGFFSSFLFCFLAIWWQTLVLCLDSLFFFVCVSIVYCWFAVSMRFQNNSLYICNIVLSSGLLISNVYSICCICSLLFSWLLVTISYLCVDNFLPLLFTCLYW